MMAEAPLTATGTARMSLERFQELFTAWQNFPQLFPFGFLTATAQAPGQGSLRVWIGLQRPTLPGRQQWPI
jgi:hypothetical protein